MPEREMLLDPLSNTQVEPIDWIWPTYLPAGELVLIDGDPEQGKSLVTLDLAARLSTGREMPDGYRPKAPADIILLAGEDRIEDTVLPRLIAAEADRARIHRLAVREPGASRSPLCLPDDLGMLERAIRKVDARMVVIDPLTMFLSPRLPTGIDSYIRHHVLTPLAQIARDTRALILLIRHLMKLLARAAFCRGAGSMAFINAARIAYLIGPDPNDEDRRLFACNKNNACTRGATLAYRIVETSTNAPRVEWLGESDVHAEDLHVCKSQSRAVDRACAFLEEALADGAIPFEELLSRAAAESISRRTLERAKTALNVTSTHYQDLERNYWAWSLPNAAYDPTKDERSRRIMQALSRPVDPAAADGAPPTPERAPPALPTELIAATDCNGPRSNDPDM
jgi:hypothetical protein